MGFFAQGLVGLSTQGYETLSTMVDVQEQNFLSSDTRLGHSVTEVQRSSCVISTNQMQNGNDMPHDKACPVLRAGHVSFLRVFTGISL